LAQRVAAAERIEVFLRPEHVAAAVRLSRDAGQPPALRALALRRVVHAVLADDSLISDLLTWVADPATPPELHRAAVTVADALFFSSVAGHARRGEFLQAFRALTSDPQPDLRRLAFSRLSAEGDDAAQRRLLEGLKGGTDAPLPPAESIELLGLRMPADAFPVLHQLLVSAPDPQTRIAAIRHLGAYPPSRADLIRIVQSRDEKQEARLAALGALHANVPEALPAIAAPVLKDPTAGDELRIFVIQAVRWRRGNSGLRLEGISDFDAAVRALADGTESELRRVAREYLAAVGAAQVP
jgi:hypothetical protein